MQHESDGKGKRDEALEEVRRGLKLLGMADGQKDGGGCTARTMLGDGILSVM